MKEEVAKILDPNASLKNVKNQEQQEKIKRNINRKKDTYIQKKYLSTSN